MGPLDTPEEVDGISYESLLFPDLSGLKAFLKDYPTAKAYCIYGGERQMSEKNIDILTLEYALKNLNVTL